MELAAHACEALEHLPFGVIAINGQGKVCYLSSSAAEILRQDDGLALRADSLRVASRNEFARFSELVSSALGGCDAGTDRCGALAISRPSGSRPYVLQIFARAPDRTRGTSPTSGAVVFVHDPESRAGLDREWLRRLYGLTPAEAKMAGLLTLGLSPATAARELGITINTARTHLKHLYGKTGTNRQSELVRLLVSMLAVGSVAPRSL